MKRIFAAVLAAVTILSLLCWNAASANAKRGKKLSIVTTIFPEYDWVRQILGSEFSNADVTMLLDNGVDLHSYQPTANDMLTIANCDLFIYVGGESDAWVETVLNSTASKDITVINLLEVLGDSVKAEELVEGMQEPEEEHDGAEEELDEHVWLSLRNAQVLCTAISDALQTLDPDNEAAYSANTAAYIEKLSALDREYQQAADSAAYHTLLFGDRFPFRYLADDYGLRYYAAFSGCSAESDASFETVLFLAKKLDALELPCVLTIEGRQHKIAETIVESTAQKNQTVLSLNSMQAATSRDVQNGASFLSIMESNLDVLKQALGVSSNAADDSEAPAAPAQDSSNVVDLTKLSSTMVYAEVFNMLSDPTSYVGKTVRMKGTSACFSNPQTNQLYYACIIADATGCCAQGLEYVLLDGEVYPDLDTSITVTGTFALYTENGYQSFHLIDAQLA